MFVSEDNSITCDSLESFLHLILNAKNDAVRQETHLYFRGESKYNQYIVPNLYLDEGLTKRSSEYYYRVLLSQIGSAEQERDTEQLLECLREGIFLHFPAPLVEAAERGQQRHEEDGHCQNPQHRRHDRHVFARGDQIRQHAREQDHQQHACRAGDQHRRKRNLLDRFQGFAVLRHGIAGNQGRYRKREASRKYIQEKYFRRKN